MALTTEVLEELNDLRVAFTMDARTHSVARMEHWRGKTAAGVLHLGAMSISVAWVVWADQIVLVKQRWAGGAYAATSALFS